MQTLWWTNHHELITAVNVEQKPAHVSFNKDSRFIISYRRKVRYRICSHFDQMGLIIRIFMQKGQIEKVQVKF